MSRLRRLNRDDDPYSKFVFMGIGTIVLAAIPAFIIWQGATVSISPTELRSYLEPKGYTNVTSGIGSNRGCGYVGRYIAAAGRQFTATSIEGYPTTGILCTDLYKRNFVLQITTQRKM